jgi:succinyl-diaminopimelate desuccinylase
LEVVEKAQKILARIERQKIAELTQELVKIPSENPPGKEKRVAEFIGSWFEKRGFEVEFFEAESNRPNVKVVLTGRQEGGKSFLLNGHMDVVPAGSGWSHDPFGGEIENGRIYGRGSADMKGGLASMMVALEEIKNSGALTSTTGSIIFTAVVDEEIGGPVGTSYLAREKGLRGDFAVIGEPTAMDVCTAHKGNITFEVSTMGKSAHASVPQLGKNAIFKMNEIILDLIEYSKELEHRLSHPLLGKPTLNIGVINGGTKSNIVPDRCTISAERRVLPGETLERAKAELEELLAHTKRNDRELDYTANFKVLIGPSELHDGKEGLQSVLKSLEKVSGKRELKPVGFVATCDAYFLTAFGKTPTIIFGPGSLSNIHKPDEYVEIAELEQASKVYALSALTFLS